MITGRTQKMLSCDWLQCFQYNQTYPHNRYFGIQVQGWYYRKGNTQTKAKGGLASLMVGLGITIGPSIVRAAPVQTKTP